MPGNCGPTFPQGKSARTEAAAQFRPGSVRSFNLTSLGNMVRLVPVGTLFCCFETEKGLGSMYWNGLTEVTVLLFPTPSLVT